MEEKMKCTFCNKENESITSFRDKPVCNDCFTELFDWAKHQEIRLKLDKIHDLIDETLKRELRGY